MAKAAFTVESFEYLPSDSQVALLRLAGVWRAGRPPLGTELVAVAGGERVTLTALPAPHPAASDVWHGAYSVPADLLGAAFELELPTERAIPLPAPTEIGARKEPPRAAGLALGREESRRRRALRRALSEERDARRAAERTAAEERERAERAEAALQEELHGAVGKAEELIGRIDDYEHTRPSFAQELEALRRSHEKLLVEERHEHDKEVARMRAELESAEHELDGARAELSAAHGHLDTLHKAHSLELGAARTQRDAALERQQSLERRLEAARAEAADLLARLEQRESLIERARAQAAEASRDSSAMQAAAVRLRDAIAARARDASAPGRRFERDTSDTARDELRRGAERIAELEREAQALRDAIREQLPRPLGSSPLQEVLPLSDEDPAG